MALRLYVRYDGAGGKAGECACALRSHGEKVKLAKNLKTFVEVLNVHAPALDEKRRQGMLACVVVLIRKKCLLHNSYHVQDKCAPEHVAMHARALAGVVRCACLVACIGVLSRAVVMYVCRRETHRASASPTRGAVRT
jgi:hypothetical protein